MKALTLRRSVYSLLGICFTSWLILAFAGDISIFYTVSTNIFMFSFMGLLSICLYGVFRTKERREVVYSVIIFGLIVFFIGAVILGAGSSGGGCTETYSGYDTGWSDVCMDEYRG